MVVNAKPAAAAFRDNPGSWGLDRIDQRSLPLDSDYVYRNLGSGVKVYVVDTGVNADHREFQDFTRPGLPTRVQEGYNAVSFEPPTPFLGGNFDCDGHGTHVAGTIAGNTVGVASHATIVPVRVVGGCDDVMLRRDWIDGINWIVRDHLPGQPAVVNMSVGTKSNPQFGGARDPELEAAVQRLIDDGITVVAAAMNESDNACNLAVGAVPGVVLVGATNRADFADRRGNFGPCVDVFAPGVDIVSAGINSNVSLLAESGTSMAAPHVAGVAAQILAANPSFTPAQVQDRIIELSTKNAVTMPTTLVPGLAESTPNRLLYNGGGLKLNLDFKRSAITGNFRGFSVTQGSMSGAVAMGPLLGGLLRLNTTAALTLSNGTLTCAAAGTQTVGLPPDMASPISVTLQASVIPSSLSAPVASLAACRQALGVTVPVRATIGLNADGSIQAVGATVSTSVDSPPVLG